VYQIAYDRLRDETLRNRASLKRKLAVREAETRLELLQARFQRDTRIVSPYAGKVVDLLITPHALVEKGTAAALLRSLNTASEDLEAILFVPAGQGKKIRVGDAVQVAPDTVRRQEHGFIRGEIRSVSEIPCTDQAMLAELKHPALVSSLVEKYRGQVLLIIHRSLGEAPSLLAAKGYQITTGELRGLRPPFVVFWDLNHLLVVEGFGRDRVYLNNPASGRRTVSLEEFNDSYAGIVFQFQPTKGFRKGGQSQAPGARSPGG
jgi:hypothetical protein